MNNTRHIQGEGYSETVIPVPAEWEGVFSHFYFAANHQAVPVHRQLLPSFQTILCFCFGAGVQLQLPAPHLPEPFVIRQSIAMGPVKQALSYTLLPGASLLVANFCWDAFYRFFGASLLQPEQYLQQPDSLVQEHCFAGMWQQLQNAPEPQHKVNLLLQAAGAYLRAQDPASYQLVNALRAGGEQSLSPVKATAGKTGQHERTVQLHYRKYLGYSAREMMRYERFMKAIGMLQQPRLTAATADWFGIIAACGYYDQSHLIRDFRHYLRLTPTQYLQLQQHICIAGR